MFFPFSFLEVGWLYQNGILLLDPVLQMIIIQPTLAYVSAVLLHIASVTSLERHGSGLGPYWARVSETEDACVLSVLLAPHSSLPSGLWGL